MNILIRIGGNDKAGVLTWLMNLSTGLKSRGCKLYYAVDQRGESSIEMEKYGDVFLLPKTLKLIQRKTVIGISVHTYGVIFYNYLAEKINNKRINSLAKQKSIEVIIVNGFISIPKIETKQTKILSVLHTVPIKDTTPFQIKSRWIGHLLNKCDLTVAVGKTVLDNLESYLKCKTKVISNASRDFSDFSDQRNELRSKFEIPSGSLCIGTLGRFCKQKGFKELIEIFDRIAISNDNIHCLIGGDPITEADKLYYKKTKQLVEESNYRNRIHLLGKVKNVSFYPMIDIFVLNSVGIEESFGIVLIEAMSAGIPVVTNGKGGPLGIIDHKQDGFLVYDDSLSAFENYICLLINDRTEYIRISQNAIKKYKNNYTLDVWYEEWFNTIKNIQ